MSTASATHLIARCSVGSGEPQLWVVAGVHGDEYEGIACAREVVQRLRPTRGTLVSVPVAHPAAVARGTRRGPDAIDLNRTFPGDRDGTPTRRVAAALWAEISGQASALITLHSWHRAGRAMPYVEYAAGDARSAQLAAALGVEWVEPWEWEPGLLPAVASQAGLAAVEIELGGLGVQSPEMLETGITAVRGALIAQGMVEGEPAVKPPRTARRQVLVSPLEGVVHQLHRVGAEVGAGEVVARVHQHDGHESGEVTATADGIVAIHCTYGAVVAGDPVTITFHAVDSSRGEDD